MSFLSKSYQIVIDVAFDTTGHGKDAVDEFNAVQKQFLATFLIMISKPEVVNIDSKCMRVDAMSNMVEVIFSEECKCLLYHRDKIGTKVDKKHAKRKAKARFFFKLGT